MSTVVTLSEQLVRASVRHVQDLAERFGDLEHAGLKGLLREEVVTNLIKPHLTMQYRVGTGVIVDCIGQQSPQADLIVWDDSILAPIYQVGAAGIFPIEAVVAIVEIKSILCSESYRQVINAQRAIKSMTILHGQGSWSGEPGVMPLSLVFGLRSDAAEKSELARYREVAAKAGIGDPGQCVQCCVVPGRASFIWNPREEPKETQSNDDHDEVVIPICGLLNSLASVSAKRVSEGPIKRGSYLKR